MTSVVTIGVVADTHGLVRPELLEALAGCDAILHAGDVGGGHVLRELEALAPLSAVRGNNDPPAEELPPTRTVELGGRRFHVLHAIQKLVEADAQRADVVVYGHSHRPALEEREGVLYLNPGSAGPPRFRLPITAARLRLAPGGIEPELVTLVERQPRKG